MLKSSSRHTALVTFFALKIDSTECRTLGKKRAVGMSTFRRALLVLVAATMATAAVAGGPFIFSSTGNLSTARYLHNAVLLNNGKLLVVGGVDGTGQNYTKSAELFDPATGTWSATGSLIKERAAATATLLLNGKVLVTGGGSTGVLASAELYDPTTGSWSATWGGAV